MPHAAWHIICGTGGVPVTEKTIVVYDGPFSVAIKIDAAALQEQAVAAGMTHKQASRRVDRFIRKVENDWDRWAEILEEKLCIEYTRHEPHPENIPDHD